ncbi:hypothetical protein MGYG_03910 [Nannizzia gypsea CBS 118893]|uniref:Uncharacterized protein n=1 Tax=Arthroderma gypseum (strain ATCC MYA-4604 / CBS 118893) TaxID=535722 RepID=E4UUE0_ARTGP|nr:hypothetical protein MGYG_03910 [Nannizzia gypsea CBS 118893]EFR00907.1 hypothetical protein MGYG_03910 [Nannizzia gypsea CBS 118893]
MKGSYQRDIAGAKEQTNWQTPAKIGASRSSQSPGLWECQKCSLFAGYNAKKGEKSVDFCGSRIYQKRGKKGRRWIFKRALLWEVLAVTAIRTYGVGPVLEGAWLPMAAENCSDVPSPTSTVGRTA